MHRGCCLVWTVALFSEALRLVYERVCALPNLSYYPSSALTLMSAWERSKSARSLIHESQWFQKIADGLYFSTSSSDCSNFAKKTAKPFSGLSKLKMEFNSEVCIVCTVKFENTVCHKSVKKFCKLGYLLVLHKLMNSLWTFRCRLEQSRLVAQYYSCFMCAHCEQHHNMNYSVNKRVWACKELGSMMPVCHKPTFTSAKYVCSLYSLSPKYLALCLKLC